MMFLMDLAFAAELIAVGIGVALLVWSYRNEGTGVAVSRVFGYIIVIAAVLSALCTTYYGLNYWKQGYYKSPIAPILIMKRQMMREHHQGMMNRMQQMHKCPMMQQQKKPG